MRTLTKREKLLVAALIGVAIIVIIYYVILPIASAASSSNNEGGTSTAKIQKLDALYEEYKRVRQEKTQLLSMLDAKNENTVTLIQQYAASNNIDKNIANTRRSQSNIQNKYIRITTEVKIEGVAIQPLIKFLSDLENGGGLIRVQYMRIAKGLKGTDTYDVLIKIDSFTNK